MIEKLRERIKHVFVLSMENRSFDHVFGSLSLNEGWEAVDGLREEYYGNFGPRADGGRGEHRYEPHALAQHRVYGARARSWPSHFDPPHDKLAVAAQMRDRMSGFVRAQHAAHPTDPHPESVLGYLTRREQPVSYFLAESFGFSDRWFTSIPTETVPNRLYALAGHSLGATKNPQTARYATGYTKLNDTLFHRLKKQDWLIYAGVMPTAALSASLRYDLFVERRLRRLERLHADVQRGEVPRVVWIEPVYSWVKSLPRGLPYSNDDHPPSDTLRGQALLWYVYNAIASNPAVWERSMLVVYYDEHGGFYDHRLPPRIEPGVVQNDGFEQLGPRVPALVVSPFVAASRQAGRRPTRPPRGHFEHCSVLKFIYDWMQIPIDRARQKRIAWPDTASLTSFFSEQLLAAPGARPAPPLPASVPRSQLEPLAPGGTHYRRAAPATAAGAVDDRLEQLADKHSHGLDCLRVALQQEFSAEFRELYPDLARLPPAR